MNVNESDQRSRAAIARTSDPRPKVAKPAEEGRSEHHRRTLAAFSGQGVGIV